MLKGEWPPAHPHDDGPADGPTYADHAESVRITVRGAGGTASATSLAKRVRRWW
ncbi:hypothetical protein [Nocardioides sp.]|uniref:hypothetical protein n=1 Tax=Nocardioides sp. TaxID=35761 RepID=UPI00271FB71B|nr:hypothetical protein [Nocardioides sp.]MDO9454529.1 hypothetical protein [Nocardioides sp.]